MLHIIKKTSWIFIFCEFCIFANPRLLIKIPTRERPRQFFACLDRYYALLSKKYEYHFLITCDEDDSGMNCDKVRNEFKKYPHLTACYGKSISKIAAYNRDLEKVEAYDLILVTSDDAIPVMDGYDQKIIETMIKEFPNFDGVLKFKDGLHNESILNTLPVVGINFYKCFGYIYHPAYKSLFCDLELTLVSKLLKKEAIIDEVLIRHDNARGATPFDALYKRNACFEKMDRKLFIQRAAKKFDLPEITKESFEWVVDILKKHHLDKI